MVFEVLRKNSPTMSVGILTANLMNLQSELTLLEQASVKIIHSGSAVFDGKTPLENARFMMDTVKSHAR